MAITSALVREIFKGHLFPFTQRDAVEAAWFQWAAETTRDFWNYASGSSGPACSVQPPR
jgi:hypothetical protein